MSVVRHARLALRAAAATPGAGAGRGIATMMSAPLCVRGGAFAFVAHHSALVAGSLLPRTAAAAAAGGSHGVASSGVGGVGGARGFMSSSSSSSEAAALSPDEVKKRQDEINDNFSIAREEIESAMEAAGTTYFDEEAEFARELTEKTLGEEAAPLPFLVTTPPQPHSPRGQLWRMQIPS